MSSEASTLRKLLESKEREILRLTARLEADRDLHVTTKQLENEVKLQKVLLKESQKEVRDMRKAIAEYDRRVDEFTNQHDLTLLKDQEIMKLRQELKTLQKMAGEKDRALLRVDRDPQQSRRLELENQNLQAEVQQLRKEKKLGDKQIRTQKDRVTTLQTRINYVLTALQRCSAERDFPTNVCWPVESATATTTPREYQQSNPAAADQRTVSHAQHTQAGGGGLPTMMGPTTGLASTSTRSATPPACTSPIQPQGAFSPPSSTPPPPMSGGMQAADTFPLGSASCDTMIGNFVRSSSPGSSVRSPSRSSTPPTSCNQIQRPPWMGPLESPRRTSSPHSSWAKRKSYQPSRSSTPPMATRSSSPHTNQRLLQNQLVQQQQMDQNGGIEGLQEIVQQLDMSTNSISSPQQQPPAPPTSTAPTMPNNTPQAKDNTTAKQTTPRDSASAGGGRLTPTRMRLEERLMMMSDNALNQDAVTIGQYNTLQRDYARALKAVEDATESAAQTHALEVAKLHQEITRLDQKYKRDIGKLKHELGVHRHRQ